jgi:hypothetical protein
MKEKTKRKYQIIWADSKREPTIVEEYNIIDVFLNHVPQTDGSTKIVDAVKMVHLKILPKETRED